MAIPTLLFGTPAISTNLQKSTLHAMADTNYLLGSWIWTDQTVDQQLCRFWKSFQIPQMRVARARLLITADNAYRLFLDGREIGRGSEWRRLTDYDLSWVLNPGQHVLALEAFNDYAEAGVILGLHVEFVDGQVMNITTDSSWRVIPHDELRWEKKNHASENWPAATIVGARGSSPWWKQNPILTTAPVVQPIDLRFWQTGWFQITMLSVCGIILLICLRLMGQLTLQSKARDILQRERARIARDIHDDLGAGLTQLVLLGEVAQSDLPANSETRTQIDQLCEKGRGLLRSMNEIIWAVNSNRDTLRDFTTYVCKYAQAFLQSTPIRCRLDIGAEMSTIPFDLAIRRNLFLAVKEALNNAVKHSGATELFLRIHYLDEKSVLVVVEDNGKGFDPVTADNERNGLSNMAARITETGGHCRIVSKPGAGCRVEFTSPLVHANTHRSKWLNWRNNRKLKKSSSTQPVKVQGTSTSRIIQPNQP